MAQKKSQGNKEHGATVTLSVRIQPRASKNDISVMEGGKVKIRLTAPPVDGAANEALIKFLSDRFKVGRSQVEIVSGHTAREKIVRMDGVTEDDVQQVLNNRK